MRLVPTSAGTLRVLDSGGAKPAILITPDGPCVIEHYNQLIALLTPSYRVVCFDMPGFGFSFPARGYGFQIEETADAVAELMDSLKIHRAVVAFSCANGFFAMNLAQRYPERVSHLVLAQTPSLDAMFGWTQRIVPRPITVPFVGQAVMAATARKFAVSWFDFSLPRGSEHKPEFVRHAREAVDRGGCFCLASLVQGLRADDDAKVRGVQCPTLLLYGDSDFSHKYTDFGSINSLIPQAQKQALTGCGHFPDLEQSQVYSSALNAFVGAQD